MKKTSHTRYISNHSILEYRNVCTNLIELSQLGNAMNSRYKWIWEGRPLSVLLCSIRPLGNLLLYWVTLLYKEDWHFNNYLYLMHNLISSFIVFVHHLQDRLDNDYCVLDIRFKSWHIDRLPCLSFFFFYSLFAR